MFCMQPKSMIPLFQKIKLYRAPFLLLPSELLPLLLDYDVCTASPKMSQNSFSHKIFLTFKM